MATNFPTTQTQITPKIRQRIEKLAAEAIQFQGSRWMYDFEECMTLEKLLGSKRLFRELKKAHEGETRC